jgi:hypothetical protein
MIISSLNSANSSIILFGSSSRIVGGYALNNISAKEEDWLQFC